MKVKVLFGVFLLAVVLPMLFIGCSEPEVTPISKPLSPYYTLEQGSKFWKFDTIPVVTAEPDSDGVSFEGIGFAGEGAYIMVQFTAPMKQSERWQQDFIWVVDEKTRILYKDVPVVPVVGTLIGRPSQEGDIGYVMLYNLYNGIKSGSVVSVVMGNYKREHIVVP